MFGLVRFGLTRQSLGEKMKQFMYIFSGQNFFHFFSLQQPKRFQLNEHTQRQPSEN